MQHLYDEKCKNVMVVGNLPTIIDITNTFEGVIVYDKMVYDNAGKKVNKDEDEDKEEEKKMMMMKKKMMTVIVMGMVMVMVMMRMKMK